MNERFRRSLGSPQLAEKLGTSAPTLALVTVAALWGITFTVVDSSVVSIPPADLVAWRFGIGAILLYLIPSRSNRDRNRTDRLDRTLRIRAVWLGLLLGAGFLLQTFALTATDAMQSGFLTSVLVVFAPVLALMLFREKVSRAAWLAVAISAAGVAVLSLNRPEFGLGEILTLAAALAWSLHLVLLSRWARREHALPLARVQTVVVALMGVLAVASEAVINGRPPRLAVPAGVDQWLSIGFLAVLSTAGAMVLISWAQARVSATKVAVILTLEPAVGAVTAVIAGSPLTGRIVVGGALLLTALLVMELGSFVRRDQPATAPVSELQPEAHSSSRLILIHESDRQQASRLPQQRNSDLLPNRVS